jgi:hypothetical protein
MTEAEQRNVHEEFYAYLLDRVRADKYPSTPQLDMLEAGTRGHQREELVDVLLEKVTADRFPSIPMLQRLARIVG